jgi:hypothetical protein
MSLEPRAAHSESEAAARGRHFLREIWRGLDGAVEVDDNVEFFDTGDLPSVFSVSDLAAAAVAAAGGAIAELIGTAFGERPPVAVDQRLASLWFGWSIRPAGWKLPAPWDSIAGDYRTADGWIRLHTNAPHHRDAVLAVLGVSADRAQVERAVASCDAEALEAAIVQRGGCAAAMRSARAWSHHEQGQRVRDEPLLFIRRTEDVDTVRWRPSRERPLRELRVLDLTRVLAGPVATRFLAGFGANVLRIDPPIWDEPGVVPDVTLGKRCTRLDLRERTSRDDFEQLLSEAHVLVHGYRADALDGLGLGAQERRRIRPGLVDVSLNAYGWSGPWRNRRGFDSLVQMSSGIAEAGMRGFGKDRPTPLPVQALDHATGYLIAAAVVRGLAHSLSNGCGFEARASLARTADLLIDGPAGRVEASFDAPRDDDFSLQLERTAFGPAQRLKAPLMIGGATMHWERPAVALGSSPAKW